MNIYLIKQEFNTNNASYRCECEYVTHWKEFTQLEFENMCTSAKIETSGEVFDVAEYLCDEFGFRLIDDYVRTYHQYE